VVYIFIHHFSISSGSGTSSINSKTQWGGLAAYPPVPTGIGSIEFMV